MTRIIKINGDKRGYEHIPAYFANSAKPISNHEHRMSNIEVLRYLSMLRNAHKPNINPSSNPRIQGSPA